MKIIRPKKIKPGDLIGIIAPSREISDFRSEVLAGLDILKNLGFRIKLGKTFNKGYYLSAGKPPERAKDFETMVADQEVKAIFCALGGDTTNQILDLIDFELLRKNPKIIIGFSDTTNLLLATWTKASLVTVHGPNLKDLPNLTTQSRECLFHLLINNSQPFYPNSIQVIRNGKAQGKLIGGNLFVINSLLATRYSPNFKNAILFFEDIDESISSLDFQLYQLKLSGILDKISGLIIGKIVGRKKSSQPLEELILTLTSDKNYPIVKVDYFGHRVKNFYPLPVGIDFSIDTKSKTIKALEPILAD